MDQNYNNTPHKRYNILTGEWVLVSPQRTQRPWQGKLEKVRDRPKPKYDPDCFLCPGNIRANGAKNPDYQDPFSFQNDFSALLPGAPGKVKKVGLLHSQSETGICKVVCFSPDHSLTLPLMEVPAIEKVIHTWKREYQELGNMKNINYVQIFENKGEMMGCSNPHPHGQIWSQVSIPVEVQKKSAYQKEYWETHQKSLLQDYLDQELESGERVLIENEHFAAVVPFWAVWPYESMIIPKRHLQHLGLLKKEEVRSFAEILKKLTTMYDNLFQTSFPYSSGIHQSPTDDNQHPEWHFHMSFYPPLLRSKTVKKFMVGYEMFAGPQRDITPEEAAHTLRSLPHIHYTLS